LSSQAGEPLLRIDPTDYELALAEARQALATAELSLADAKALRQAARVDEAKAAVAAAKARIARAERDLDSTEISAPYNAVIDEQRVELGQFINAGTAVGRVLGADKAEVRLPDSAAGHRFHQRLGNDPRLPCMPTSAARSGAGGHGWRASRHALTSRRASSRWWSRSRIRWT
jgi:multidrug resistance efflux pump